MSSRRRLRAVALADQTAAAQADAAGIFEALRAGAGGRPAVDCAPTGPVASLVEQFYAVAAAGQVYPCAHLHPRFPCPTVWMAWRRTSLWCVPCATAHRFGGIEGTEEDRRCDYCGSVGSRIHPYRALVPAVVAPGLGVATPPVLVLAGLCPTCHQADRGARNREQTVPWN